MPFKWKGKIVSFGGGTQALNVASGTSSYASTASGAAHWTDVTINGNLYISRTVDFRVSGTLTIGSTGNIIATTNIAGEAGSGTAYVATTADDTLPVSSNGANGSPYGSNCLKIMANKIINNGLISANGASDGGNSANGASAGFIWIVSPDISGAAGARISCSGGTGGPAWSRGASGCSQGGVIGYNCVEFGGGCNGSLGGSGSNLRSSEVRNTTCDDYGGNGPAGYAGSSSSITIVTSKTPTGGHGSYQAVSLDTSMVSLALGTIVWFKEKSQWVS